jgi:hypothetical protein
MTSTPVTSFDMDFKKISDGLTLDKSHNPNLQKPKTTFNNQEQNLTIIMKQKENH